MSCARSATPRGRWVRSEGPPPYQITRATWHTIGLNGVRDTPRSAHNYGVCDLLEKNRTLYEWRPTACRLRPLTPSTVCSRMSGLILFVGDSSMAQLYLAFALLSNATLGRNSVNGATLMRHTASACDDRLRLSFLRSDVLLFPPRLSCATSFGFRADNALAHAAVADRLVLGVGQHYASTVGRIPLERRHRYLDFLVRSLNYTLSTVSAVRRGWRAGRAAGTPEALHLRGRTPEAAHLDHTSEDGSDIVLMGPSLAVPDCGSYSQPASSTVALLHAQAAAVDRGYPWAASWQENIRINELSRWTAAELGVPYVDVAQMSLLRPDGAMSTKGKGVGEDCVHYCLPGPPDAFAQLAFNALLGDGGSREGGSRDGGSPPPESRGSPPPESNASAPSWSARGHPAGWLTQRGANAQVGCGACGHATCCGVPVERAESQPWWPFAAGNCSW